MRLDGVGWEWDVMGWGGMGWNGNEMGQGCCDVMGGWERWDGT